jgi:hypothetical protein
MNKRRTATVPMGATLKIISSSKGAIEFDTSIKIGGSVSGREPVPMPELSCSNVMNRTINIRDEKVTANADNVLLKMDLGPWFKADLGTLFNGKRGPRIAMIKRTKYMSQKMRNSPLMLLYIPKSVLKTAYRPIGKERIIRPIVNKTSKT